ncbi:MAG: hypothetical protein KDK27_21335, partial [Leptospiraceae bacterium]|nr:hypothetical protein [Leptospiraceae bacterium]
VYAYTLHTNFHLSLADRNQLRDPGLLFPGIGESYSVYLNGTLLASSMPPAVYARDPQPGIATGYSATEETGLYADRLGPPRFVRNLLITFDRDLLKEQNEIIVHVRGYAPTSVIGGNFLFGLTVTEGYLLGSESDLNARRQQYLSLMLYGVFIFFGLYHIFLFIRRHRETYNFYFGAFSIILAAYLLAFTNHAYELIQNSGYLMLVGYAAQPLALMFFLLFLENYFYPDRRLPRWMWAFVAANGAVVLFILLAPYRFYQTGLTGWYFFAAPQI